jgi:hypothetical protein
MKEPAKKCIFDIIRVGWDVYIEELKADYLVFGRKRRFQTTE